MVVLAGLVVFSMIALYIHYPAPQDVFTEIMNVRAHAFVAVNTGHSDEAIRQIQHWDSKP